ncbi:ABC transporter substrate-binding protein [Microvirga massiliensis]|uniref:ABC transporter substrate-binding protein n=1 Tax=Microvirga massiliensis TaxID=1033741 RepID=UPI00062B2FEF|nr:ABC transporter substrate-binding protein [Microvirga massiliensis]
MDLTRRDVLAGVGAAAASFALPGGSALAQSKKSVLRVVPHANLQILDPIFTTQYITRNYGYLVYDTLFALDENFQPQPQMVDTFEVSPDRLRYVFKLRDGLAWHDDTPVTAEDCVASLIRWSKRDPMGQRLFKVVDKLEAQDAKTFVMTLKQPYGLVLDTIGKISSNVPFMMPKRVAETPADQQIQEAIGSGPFMFRKDEWRPGNLAVWVKSPTYKPRSEPVSSAAGGKIAKVDRVEWHVMDTNTAMNALLAGEIDFWEQVTPDLVPIVQQAPGVKVENLDPVGNMGWGRFNHLVAPSSNPLIRRAAMKAVNQEDYLRTAIGNPELYRVNKSIFPVGTPYHTDAGAEMVTQNLNDAKALLQEAGYKGEEFAILHPTDHPVLNPFTLVTAESLRRVGFNVKLVAMDWATLGSRRTSREPVSNGGWNMFHTWWIGGDVINPLTGVGFAAVGEQGWPGWHKDEQIEKLRGDFASAATSEEAKKVAAEFQRRTYEIGSYINCGQYFVPVGYRDNVKGMIRSPVQFFWNMEVA